MAIKAYLCILSTGNKKTLGCNHRQVDAVATVNMHAYEFKRVGAKNLFGVFSPATEGNKRGTRLYCDSVVTYYLGFAGILFNLAQQTEDLWQKVEFLQQAEQALNTLDECDTARTFNVMTRQ